MFTDDMINELKKHCDEPGAVCNRLTVLELLDRLEAAENTLQSCKRYTYDDGLVIVEEPDVELFEAWRKSAGKP